MMNSAGSGGINVPARKIGPEQFYKPPGGSSLTPSQSQPTNVGAGTKSNKFERYESPIIKLN